MSRTPGICVLCLLMLQSLLAQPSPAPGPQGAATAAQQLSASDPSLAAAINAALYSETSLCIIPSGYVYHAPVLPSLPSASSSVSAAGRKLLGLFGSFVNFCNSVGNDITQAADTVAGGLTTAAEATGKGLQTAATTAADAVAQAAEVAAPVVAGAVVSAGTAVYEEAKKELSQDVSVLKQSSADLAAAKQAGFQDVLHVDPEVAKAMAQAGIASFFEQFAKGRRLLAAAVQVSQRHDPVGLSTEQYATIEPCCEPTTVQAGDTLDSLTKMHNLPDGLLAATNIVNGTILVTPGDSITIPCPRFLAYYTAYTTSALASTNNGI